MELFTWYRFRDNNKYIFLTNMIREYDHSTIIWSFASGNLDPYYVDNFEVYENRDMIKRWPPFSSYDYHRMVEFVFTDEGK